LTLDPTPSSASQDGALFSWLRWLGDSLLDSRNFWKQLILDYTPEQQIYVLTHLGRGLLSRAGLAASLIVLIVVTMMWGRWNLGRRLLASMRRWLPGVAPT